MRTLFGARHRIRTWRQLWIWLAEAQHELGLDVTTEQLDALRTAQDDIDFEKAAEYEARFRHDVMAHVHTYGDAAPAARGVIHLGATSCFVTDNADLLVLREGLKIVETGLANAAAAVAAFARGAAGTPCLAYTHFQPAQPTTFGKRACLWLHDLLDDLRAVRDLRARVPFRGAKGTTGTQASFLQLFGGDGAKCDALDESVARKAGFDTSLPVTGQTYSRKFDYELVATLGGIGVSATRFAHDVRLLSGFREAAEPFGKDQIGSSAMAYKQNPMRSERITALARHLLALVPEAATTAAAQWLERTLDDSAARRIFLPEAFLAADAVLRLVTNVGRGLHVNEAVARARLLQELPFMATEDVLMRAVKAGGDRQVLHERIRVHSLAAKERLMAGATDNDLIDRLQADDAFAALAGTWEGLLQPERFVGRATEQTTRYLTRHVEPTLAPYADVLGAAADLAV